MGELCETCATYWKQVQSIGHRTRRRTSIICHIVSNGSKTDADETDSETDTTSEGKVLDSCRICCIEQLK